MKNLPAPLDFTKDARNLVIDVAALPTTGADRIAVLILREITWKTLTWALTATPAEIESAIDTLGHPDL